MACEELTTTSLGKGIVVADDENCLKELVQSDGGQYPAIPVAISDDSVALRDGSSSQPIQLPHLQRQWGGAFSNIMVQDGDGIWFAYTPDSYCLDQKLIVRDGQFVIVPDTLPTLLASDICEINACDQYDFLLGVKEVVIVCDGEDVTYLKVVKVPKALCPTCEETV